MMRVYPSSPPLVSVILCTFNRARLLPRSIRSVLNQSFQGWELIVVDDGSTDATFKVVNAFLRKHPRIRYLKHKNHGLPFSKNVGIMASVGNHITFLDSDDEYLPDHLKKRVSYMQKHPKTDIIYGGLKIIGSPYVPDKYDPSRLIHLSRCQVGGTFFGKRNIFTRLKGFPNVELDDTEFLDRARTVSRVDKVNFRTYVYHRETAGSLMKNYTKKYHHSH